MAKPRVERGNRMKLLLSRKGVDTEVSIDPYGERRIRIQKGRLFVEKAVSSPDSPGVIEWRAEEVHLLDDGLTLTAIPRERKSNDRLRS